jgi:hypothetical protein
VGVGLVLVDLAQRDPALEAAVVALGNGRALVAGLGPLLAADGQHAVVDGELDVLLVKAGQLGGHLPGVVGLVHLQARPAGRHQGRGVEAAEDVVEQAVHLLVQPHERAELGREAAGVTVAERKALVLAAPRDKVTKSHHCAPSLRVGSSGRIRPDAGSW